jgi:sugar phosphate isomerase/epimerase
MAVENMPARGQRRPGVAIAEVAAIVDGLGDHVGICLDVGHSNLSGLDATDEVSAAGERLLALHLQDNDGNGEDQHLLPGQGTVDWDAVLNAIDRLDFRGPRTLEVIDRDHVDASLRDLAALLRKWQLR